MGAVPKNKVSRHRRGNRRREQVLVAPSLITCPNCRKLMQSHRVCKSCGQYRGRQVVQVDQPNAE